MNKQSLHTVEDNQFGRGSPYAWPGNIHEARRFLAMCTDLKSSGECLECNFYEEDDAEDVRERFKDATKWPLPYLVASAAYCFLAWRNRMAEKICNGGRIDAFDWENLFFVLLNVGEPLFEMIHRNGWAKSNQESIREGFTQKLELVVEWADPTTQYVQIQWFREREASWFQIEQSGKIYYYGKFSPENLLRCLKLAGTNETVARLAVKKVFETETLNPFYTALLPATATPPLSANDEKGEVRTVTQRAKL